MSNKSRDRVGLTILLVVILAALLFINPFFRYSCSRVFMHDFLGMDHGQWTVGPLFSMHGFAYGLPLLVMLFLWAALALWVYHDAEERGHSGLLWGLFVFFGNFIGLIIYLIVRTTSSEPAVGYVRAGAAKCPSCGNPIRSTYVACPHCGTSLVKTCPSCGKRVEADWHVCAYCGHHLAEASSGD